MENVLHLIGSFRQGGSERQAVQLVRSLRRDARFRVFVGVLDAAGELRSVLNESHESEIPEFPLTGFYDLNMLRQVRRCVNYIRANDIRILQTHDFYTNIFGMICAVAARVPVRIAAKRETGGMRTWAQRFVEQNALRLATAVVANSSAVKDHLVGCGTPRSKITVIRNGIDLERFELSGNTPRETVCREFGLPDGPGRKFVVMTANFRHDVKNHAMLLRAAARILQKGEKAEFVFAGEGELLDSCRSMAEKLGIAGSCHFIGRCTDVPRLLSISDVCVLTSKNEGFSNAIIEYMAASRPVVATDVGGAREAVEEGVTGYLVASEDDASLAARTAELLSDSEKAQTMGRAARESAEHKFSINSQTELTAALYRSQLLLRESRDTVIGERSVEENL